MDLRFFRLLVSRRVFAVIKKDSIRLFRDRSMILLMLSQPILIMLVAGFGFTSDIRHLGAVVVQERLYAGGMRELLSLSPRISHRTWNPENRLRLK